MIRSTAIGRSTTNRATRLAGCIGLVLVEASIGLAASSPQSVTQGQITGRVATPDGKPAADAALALVMETGQLPSAAPLRRVIPVDDQGRFTIADVPPGAYRIVIASATELREWPSDELVARFSKRGLPARLSPQSPSAEFVFTATPTPGEPRGLMVTGAMSTSLMAIGPSTAGGPPGAPRRPGSINAPGLPPRSTGPASIAGRVTYRSGAPVVGVQVQAGRRSGSAVLPYGEAATTDTEGHYRITGLQPGSYLVAAMAWRSDWSRTLEDSAPNVPPSPDSDGRLLGLQTTYHPATTRGLEARMFEVDLERQDVDIVVTQVPVTQLKISVADHALTPGPPRMATLAPVSTLDQFSMRNAPRAIATKDAFTFVGIPPGRYLFWHQGTTGWARDEITVSAAEPTTELSMPLKSFFTVKGRVEFRPTRLQASAADRKSLMVELRSSPPGLGSIVGVPIADDGTFTIPRVSGGPQILRLAPGSSWIALEGRLDGIDTLDRPYTMTSSMDDALLVVTDVDTTIQGTVRAPDGDPQVTGRVVVFGDDPRDWIAGGRRVRVTSILPGGGFNLSGLPPGNYLAAAVLPGVVINNSFLANIRDKATPFVLLTGQTKGLQLTMIR